MPEGPLLTAAALVLLAIVIVAILANHMTQLAYHAA